MPTTLIIDNYRLPYVFVEIYKNVREPIVLSVNMQIFLAPCDIEALRKVA